MDLSLIPPKQPNENGRQYAYRVLYDNIMSLAFPPGMVLADAELSQMLNVSRTPVREAILSLADAKLVTICPQRSSTVSRIDLDAVEEGVFLRYNIERAVYNEAVQKANGKSIAQMLENLEQQRILLDNNELNKFLDCDDEFHKLLYLSVGRYWTWRTVKRIVTHHDRLRHLQVRMGIDGNYMRPSYDDHQIILNSIVTRSTQEYSEMLSAHLVAAYRSLLPALMEKCPSYFEL